MADNVFLGYDNFVLENAIKSALDTKLDINRFLTPDYDLVENAGMTKKIHRYVITDDSDVDDLARGEGNSNFIEARFDEFAYTVGRTQGQIIYYDDDILTDPALIDAKVRFLSESMVNNWTRKAIAEFGKTENIYECSGYNLENFANALSKYTAVYEDTAGLFFLANQKLDAKIRKMLGDDLKYVEDYIRTGAIGAVLGIPVYLSKAVPEGLIFLATREAVKAFVKRNVSIEQDRDINTKKNNIVASRYSVIALVDETKCVAIGAAQSTAVTITSATKATTTIAGAATDGAYVEAFVNGVEVGHATASSGYSITSSKTLAAGDVVKVIAHLDGKVNSIASVTVAE